MHTSTPNKPHIGKEAHVYTTTIPAHAVTQGMQLAFVPGTVSALVWTRGVETTRWISDPITKRYTETIINGACYNFNEPVKIVVGGAVKAR